jgi:hypothetical protein
MPSIARTKEVVVKVATLAGEPLSVDDLSLIKTGPVMVKINCRDPYKLRGFVKIFFNKMGYEIKFVLEKYEDKSNLPPCLPHKHQDHMEEEDNDDSEDEDSDRKHKKGSVKNMWSKGSSFVLRQANHLIAELRRKLWRWIWITSKRHTLMVPQGRVC